MKNPLIDSSISDLDENGETWNNLLFSYFDKIKSNQEKLSLLIKQHRREQMKQTKEMELREKNEISSLMFKILNSMSLACS